MTGCQFLPVMKKDFEDELGCLAPIKTGEKRILYIINISIADSLTLKTL